MQSISFRRGHLVTTEFEDNRSLKWHAIVNDKWPFLATTKKMQLTLLISRYESHHGLKKIRSTFSENKNGKFICDIEIRMPATKTDDKRIQIFIVRKPERKLDILLFAVRLSTWS